MQSSIKSVIKKFLRALHLVPLSSYSFLERSVIDRLQIAENSMDYQFRKFMGQYIETEVLPRAARVCRPDYAGPTYVKQARQRFLPVNAKSGYQNFILELDCLSRLNEALLEAGKSGNFPVLVDFDTENLTITCSHNGVSLKDLKKTVVIPEPARQIQQIIETLETARVRHLDMHPSGKNILVDDNGLLTVIDFDMAQVDGLSLTSSVDDRIANDEMVLTRARLLQTLNANKHIVFSPD